jgi:hypothetical protein
VTTHFEIAQKPSDGQWYVIGPCGDGHWMPVSEGYGTLGQAILARERIAKAERSQFAELKGWDGRQARIGG